MINRPTFSGKTEENNKVLWPWIAHLSPGPFGPVVKKMSFKMFLILASVAILFSRAERFVPFW